MIILQINAVGQVKSTGRNCQEIAEYINQTTDYVCYTAFADGNIDEHNIKIGNKLDHKLHAFLSRLTGKQAYFSRFATKRLIKFIQNQKIDTVILNNLHGNYIHLPLLLKYLAQKDIATIVVLHDCWFYTGKCAYYVTEQCFRWKTGCRNCPQLKKDNISWFRDATKQMWKDKKMLFEAIPRLGVVGVSDWITDEARSSILGKAKIIRRIYNWIDLEIFSPKNTSNEWKKKFGIEGKKVILGVASDWNQRKGLNSFLELSNCLSDNYHIVLVGNMPKGVNLSPKITTVSATNSMEELVSLYDMADVFVTLSLEETFGKVSAEALACGTPVICFDSTANKELVGEGCGQVLDIKDKTSLHKAIETICDNGKEKYTNNCRLFAEKNFGKEERIKEYLKLFGELLKN